MSGRPTEGESLPADPAVVPAGAADGEVTEGSQQPAATAPNAEPEKRDTGTPSPPRDKFDQVNAVQDLTIELLKAYTFIGLEQQLSVPKEFERIIASAFRRYLDGGGTISLDEAFGLSGRRRAGHPLRRHERDVKYALAMIEVAREQIAHGSTVADAAAKVAERAPFVRYEVLLKKYNSDGIGGSLRDMVRRQFKGRATQE